MTSVRVTFAYYSRHSYQRIDSSAPDTHHAHRLCGAGMGYQFCGHSVYSNLFGGNIRGPIAIPQVWVEGSERAFIDPGATWERRKGAFYAHVA